MRTPKELTGEAAAYWKRNAPLCEAMGTLTDSDRDTFILLCMTWGRLQELPADAQPIQYTMYAKQYQNLSKLFGLDPMSRKKLNITLEEETPDEYGL